MAVRSSGFSNKCYITGTAQRAHNLIITPKYRLETLLINVATTDDRETTAGKSAYVHQELLRLYFVETSIIMTNNNSSVALVLQRTIQTERTPHIGEVSATFCG
jgi:hypothetical protein